MTNKYTGEVDITIGNRALKLRYDWAAIAEIMTMHGSDVLAQMLQCSPAIIADVLASGLKGQMTAAEIAAASPPLMTMITAIDKALAFAYYGPDGPPPPASKKKLPTVENPAT